MTSFIHYVEPLLQDWERDGCLINCVVTNRIKQDEEQRSMFKKKKRAREQDKNSEKNLNKREISNLIKSSG